MGDIRENRWLMLVYTAGLTFLGIAFVLFFGQILNRFQPFFSIALIVICLIWVKIYFSRLFKLLKSSKAKTSYFNYLLEQELISSGLLVASVIILFLRNVTLYWGALGFFLAGLVLMISISGLAWPQIKGQLASSERGEEIEGVKQEGESEAAETAGLIVGISLVAVAYILVFTPLTTWIAHSRGLDIVNVLLFVDFSGISISHGFIQELARLVAPANAPFLFSFGALYGVAAVAFVLLQISLKRGKWTELIIMSNGLMLGYAATIGISFLLGITPTLIHASQISFAYVFVLIYLCRAITEAVSRWGIKAKYETAIGGIQGVGAAWILSRIFGDQSVIFSGLIFYTSTFVMTSLFELLFHKIWKWLFGELPAEEIVSLNSNLWQTIRLGGKDFWTYTGVVAVIGTIFPLIAYGLVKLVTDAMCQ